MTEQNEDQLQTDHSECVCGIKQMKTHYCLYFLYSFLSKVYFMCLNSLSTCISVYLVCTMPEEAREGYRINTAGVTGGC